MNKLSPRHTWIVAIIFAAVGLSGCTPKNITYFQDVTNDSAIVENTANKQIKVKPNDKLSIVVKSKDGELSQLFNLPIVTNSVNTTTTNSTEAHLYNQTSGMSFYNVDPAGDIDFPVIGHMHISGMTRSELAGFIKGELMGRNLLKDPTVIVEFVNTGISVLGEVNRPGRFDLNRDNISILDALALAGDMTIQGQRNNVKVIREENGKRQIYVIDLTKGNDILKSPAFYLQQDDVVYVEPNDIKKRQATANGNIVLQASFWVSVASLLTSIAVLIFK